MLLLYVLLILMLVGMLPVYPYSTNWGYGPSGGFLLLALLVLLLVPRRDI